MMEIDQIARAPGIRETAEKRKQSRVAYTRFCAQVRKLDRSADTRWLVNRSI